MHTYFLGLILRDIPNSITPQNHPPPATNSSRTACTPLYPPVQAVPPTPPPPFFPVLDRGTGEGQYLCPGQVCATTACSECAC